MSVNVLYTPEARATGARDGHATNTDGSLHVKLTTPKTLGGAGGEGSKLEQRFAAGYAACFLSAMKFVASQGGPKVPAGAIRPFGPSAECPSTPLLDIDEPNYSSGILQTFEACKIDKNASGGVSKDVIEQVTTIRREIDSLTHRVVNELRDRKKLDRQLFALDLFIFAAVAGAAVVLYFSYFWQCISE